MFFFRWNVGIFLGAFPCGVVPLWDELFECESIAQVYGVFVEYLSQLPVEEREMLTDLIYDDSCHLARFATRKNLKDRNDVTRFFAEKVRKNVDRFHFGNHVDNWCQENCDPNKVRELDGVNTEICEQLFRKVNSHSNCKSMNESRYFMFWLKNLDMHNLEKEGVSVAADPRCDYRWSNVNIKEMKMDGISKFKVDDVIVELAKVSIETDTDKFACDECDGKFSSKGFLDNHKMKKHGEVLKPYLCEECDKILKSKRNLEDHIKRIHRSCKFCNLTFNDGQDLENHKKVHTSCDTCKKDFKTKSKLERHLKTHM